MLNLIDMLFGLAITTSVAAVILFGMRRRPLAKKFGLVALATGAAAVLLELVVRYAA